MKNKKLSVVISAYNEEQKIRACLESASFGEEIIVVDSGSTDLTATTAKEFGAKVFRRENSPMLNINKNFGFSKASGDWILSLDADERVTPELKDEILREVGNPNASGYWIPRKNIIFGKWIQSDMWWPDYQLRLFKAGKGRFPEKHVHEYLQVDGETRKLKEPMIHENYNSISQYLYKLDKIYTENEVENFLSSGKKIMWIDAIRFPAQDFIKTFFAQRGYKDGLHGLVLSLLQAFYMEIVFAKIWERQGFYQYNNSGFVKDIYRESKKITGELRYWLLTSLINQEDNPFKRLIYRFWRKQSI